MIEASHTPRSARPGLANRIAESLGLGGDNLNELDFDDLFVSEKVMKTLQDITEAIAQKSPEAMTALSAYWVRESHELVLCADVEGKLHLVRVPDAHWKVKPRTYH